MSHQPEYSKGYWSLRLHNGHDSYIGMARHRHDKLRVILDYLPPVDENGHSECPFAKQLFRQKERAEQEVASAIDLLRDVENAITAEVQRAQRAIERMDAARVKIHGRTVRQFVGGLLDAEKEQLRRANLQGQEVKHWIGTLATLLAASRAKQWPQASGTDRGKEAGKTGEQVSK